MLTQNMFNFAYVINSKCNNSYLQGVEILHKIKYLVFHNYFVFFGKQFFFPELTFSGLISFRY